MKEKSNKASRLLAVLEYLTSGEPPPTHADLTRELDIQRSTLSDLLTDLRHLGYVDVVDRRYIPGLRLLTFIKRAANQPDLGAAISPALRKLEEATGETAVYSIEVRSDGSPSRRVVSVEQRESHHQIRFVGPIGEPWPIDDTAAGKVFLAIGESLTDGAAPSSPVLADDLKQIRTQGLARVRRASDGSAFANSTAVAGPVFDRRNQLLGVISIVGPNDRMDAHVEEIERSLREQLAQLKKTLY